MVKGTTTSVGFKMIEWVMYVEIEPMYNSQHHQRSYKYVTMVNC